MEDKDEDTGKVGIIQNKDIRSTIVGKVINLKPLTCNTKLRKIHDGIYGGIIYHMLFSNEIFGGNDDVLCNPG